MPSSTKPAFGQVWKWHTYALVLIASIGDYGEWLVWLLRQDRIVEMGGLTDDPAERLDGWELLSEEDT